VAEALDKLRKEVQRLPGFAEERLRLVSDALAAAEPSLIEEGEPEPQFVRRAFLRGVGQLPSITVMHKALAGGTLHPVERVELELDVDIVRGEARRLHDELVERIRRGEGEARIGAVRQLFRRTAT
jgi:hypothetical protein